MTDAQFTAICRLIRSPEGPAREAARLVLVTGMRQCDAALVTGASRASVSNTLRRVRAGAALALATQS